MLFDFKAMKVNLTYLIQSTYETIEILSIWSIVGEVKCIYIDVYITCRDKKYGA